MELLVGLGNPGSEYIHNRHNVGFMLADFIATTINPSHLFKFDKYLHAEIVKLLQKNEELVIAKPQTFMNLSGKAVKKIMTIFKIEANEVFIAHDDLDIPLGKFKIQKGTGPKLHNGLSSTQEHLGTAEFWRVRIGVENRTKEHYIPGEAYVLQDFMEDEKKLLHETTFPAILSRLEMMNKAR